MEFYKLVKQLAVSYFSGNQQIVEMLLDELKNHKDLKEAIENNSYSYETNIISNKDKLTLSTIKRDQENISKFILLSFKNLVKLINYAKKLDQFGKVILENNKKDNEYKKDTKNYLDKLIKFIKLSETKRNGKSIFVNYLMPEELGFDNFKNIGQNDVLDIYFIYVTSIMLRGYHFRHIDSESKDNFKSLCDYKYVSHFIDALKAIIKENKKEQGDNIDVLDHLWIWLYKIIAEINSGNIYFSFYDNKKAYGKYKEAVKYFYFIGTGIKKYNDWSKDKFRSMLEPKVYNELIISQVVNHNRSIIVCQIRLGSTIREFGYPVKALKWFLRSYKNLAYFEKYIINGQTNIFQKWPKLNNDVNDIINNIEMQTVRNIVNKKIIISKFKSKEEQFLSIDLFVNNEIISLIITFIGYCLFLLRIKDSDSKFLLKWFKKAFDIDSNNYLSVFDKILVTYKMTGIDDGEFCEEDIRNVEPIVKQIQQLFKQPINLEKITIGNDRGLYIKLFRIFAMYFKWVLTDETINSFIDITQIKNDHSFYAELLLHNLLNDFETIVTRPFRYNSYLARSVKKKNVKNTLTVLKQYNSFTPLVPRPECNEIKGGGFLINWKGKGIVIDPGIDFIKNLYEEGFSIDNIDFIIITHGHIDHIQELGAILALRYEINDYLEKRKLNGKKGIYIISTVKDFGAVLNHFVSFKEGTINDIEKFNEGKITKEWLEENGIEISGFPVEHMPEQNNKMKPAYGFTISLYDNNKNTEPKIRIGYTSDTKYMTDYVKRLEKCDIVILNIGDANFRELAGQIDTPFGKVFKYFEPYLDKIKKGERNKIKEEFSKLLGFDGYRKDRKNKSGKFFFEDIKNDLKKRSNNWQLDNHLGFFGLYNLITSLDKCKLFIISEFPEELGSYRHRVARILNKCLENLGRNKHQRVFTGDIGLSVDISDAEEIKMKCIICNNDNDMIDKYSSYIDIDETSAKGSNEKMFYFCKHHKINKSTYWLHDMSFYEPYYLV